MSITYGPTPPPPPTGMSQSYVDILREDLQEDTIQTFAKFVDDRVGIDILTKRRDVRRDFGAVGDGVADDTTAFQAAIDYFENGNFSGVLEIPTGTYRISSTLTYIGSNTTSIHFRGDTDMYAKGSTLLWVGAAAGTLFNTKGMVKSTFQDINFHGNEIAKYVFHQQSNQPDAGSASYGNKWLRCTITGATGTGSGCMVVGTSGGSETHQVSEGDYHSCSIGGANAKAAFLQLTNGNTKNFRFWGGEINRGEVLVNCTLASGSYEFSGVFFGAASSKFLKFGSTAFISMIACEAETSGSDQAIWLEGAATSNPGSCSMIACDINIKGPNDDLCIKWYGGLTIEGGQFWNSRQGETTNLFKIAVAAQLTPGLSGPGSISSHGAYYPNALSYAPFYDDGGNAIAGTDDARANPYQVESIGDYGGLWDGTKLRLKNYKGYYPEEFGPYQARESGKTPTYSGRPTQCVHRWDFTFTDFQAAAVNKTIDLLRPRDGAEVLCKAYLTCGTAFAGTAGTLQMRVGTSPGGQEVLLAKDVKTAAFEKYGKDSADLGTALTTGISQGGYLDTTPYNMKVQLVSGSGNLSGLTAGACTIWIVTEHLP